MGVDIRKPPLPAPTESSTLQTSRDSVIGTDLATNISRRTDRTSFSIPEDGSPITISTKKKRDHREKEQHSALTRTSHQSQTSLLIEYFEGGKGPTVHSRPSVRVKVTPSAARKIKDGKDHIQITEAGGYRRPSYSRRISLGPNNADTQQIESPDDRSISSYTSAAEESSLAGRRPPIEIEVMHKDQGSDLSSEQRYIQQNASDISSMPPDSMLDGNAETLIPHRTRSRSMSRDAVITSNNLKTPSRRRSRSLSRERLTQKVIEKLGSKPREISSRKHKHGSKSRSRSVSKEHLLENIQSPRRKSSRHHREEELPSAAESSLLSNSQVSTKRKSGDQYSYKSGTSTSSLNNPKLLQTVEDAIRRLILPELTQLKHEQARQKFDREHRDSNASEGSASHGEMTRRVSKHASAPNVSAKPKVILNGDEYNPGTVLSGNTIKGRKEHRYGRDLDSPSERSFDRGVSEETVIRDERTETRKKSKEGHHLRNAAAGAIAGGILTTAALRHHDSRSSDGKRERRKRSSKSRSRSASLAESTEDIFYKHDVPPMPMRSDINESELTRDSILSERTSTPTSERRRAEIREVVRGSPKELMSPTSRTPTRTPTRTPVALQRGLGTHHSNLSHGNVSLHSVKSDRSLREQDHYSKTEEAILSGATAEAGLLAEQHLLHRHDGEDGHTFARHAHNRGLSPIQSVASYDEESELPNRESFRQTHSSESLSSAARQHKKNSTISIDSISSVASTKFARSNRPKGIHLEDGKEVLQQHDLRASELSELSREGSTTGDAAIEEWYDRQHEENDRYRDETGDSSLRDSTVDVKHMTNYTDDSLDAPYLHQVTAAQHVHGIGANLEYIRTPVAVESAVASLHDPSILDVRSTQSGWSKFGPNSHRDSSNMEVEEEPDVLQESRREINVSDHESPGKEPTETGKSRPFSESSYGAHSAANSPRQSIAQSTREENEYVSMGTTGLPNAEDPMPEIGHGLDSESDINTNPSIIQGPMGGVPHENRDHWPYHPTPPLSKGEVLSRSNDHSAHESLKAAAAGMLSAAASASREREKDNEFEQEDERDVPFIQDRLPTTEGDYERNVNHDFGPIRDSYMSGQTIPTPPLPKDEGYISAANPPSGGARTPERTSKAFGMYDDEGAGGIDNIMGDDDPFVGQARARHLSGNSHGMPSPLYDSATGRGIDRIQSKDIVALMDHVSHACYALIYSNC